MNASCAAQEFSDISPGGQHPGVSGRTSTADERESSNSLQTRPCTNKIESRKSQMSIARRLSELHIDLPTVPTPVANYVPTRQSGSLVFTSGQTPTKDGVLQYPGKLGLDVTVEQGQRAAELAALNCLAALHAHLGSLDRITAGVNLTGCMAFDSGLRRSVEGHQRCFPPARADFWRDRQTLAGGTRSRRATRRGSG